MEHWFWWEHWFYAIVNIGILILVVLIWWRTIMPAPPRPRTPPDEHGG